MTDHKVESVTAGMVGDAEMCADLQCSLQTPRKREKEGMPVMRIGIRHLYDPAKVRAWFEARSAKPGDAA